MTGTKITLELKAESTEGIHDLIALTEKVIEDMKGGVEIGVYYLPDGEVSWKINTTE